MEVSGTGQGADKSDSVAGGEGSYNDLGKTVKIQLRADTTTKLGGVEYKFLESLIYGPNSAPLRQAPTGFKVLGHMLWLNKESKGKRVRMTEVVRSVASDLSDLWVFGLNIYPCSLKGIRVKLEATYKEFTRIRDYTKEINTIKHCRSSTPKFRQGLTSGQWTWRTNTWSR